MYVYLSLSFYLFVVCVDALSLSLPSIPFAMFTFTFGSDARSLCVVDIFFIRFAPFLVDFPNARWNVCETTMATTTPTKVGKNNEKTTEEKKQKKNVHFFDTIHGSFGRVRHIFHVKFATHRTESEHVHQIFYSMIPFAFMLVAYCMRFPLCSYYIMAHVTTNSNTYVRYMDTWIHTPHTQTQSQSHESSRIDSHTLFLSE